MGKWILYALILLNVFAFLWFYSHADENTDNSVPAKPVLLNSELISIVKPKPANSTAKPAVNSEPKSEVINENVVQDPLGLIAERKLQQTDKKPTAKNTADAKHDVTPTPLKPSLAPPANKHINTKQKNPNSNTQLDVAESRTSEEQKLVDEMASMAQNSSLPQTDTEAALNNGVPVNMLCYQYGPLNKIQADEITTVMEQQQIAAIQQSRVVSEARGFLVLIMPQKTTAQSKTQMRVARKAGLDAFTITKGEWMYGVSLGIFSAKQNADNFFKKAKKLLPRSKIAIQKRVKESEVFRILFKLQKDQDPSKLLTNSPFPSFDLKNPLQITTKIAKKSCESVEF